MIRSVTGRVVMFRGVLVPPSSRSKSPNLLDCEDGGTEILWKVGNYLILNTRALKCSETSGKIRPTTERHLEMLLSFNNLIFSGINGVKQ